MLNSLKVDSKEFWTGNYRSGQEKCPRIAQRVVECDVSRRTFTSVRFLEPAKAVRAAIVDVTRPPHSLIPADFLRLSLSRDDLWTLWTPRTLWALLSMCEDTGIQLVAYARC